MPIFPSSADVGTEPTLGVDAYISESEDNSRFSRVKSAGAREILDLTFSRRSLSEVDAVEAFYDANFPNRSFTYRDKRTNPSVDRTVKFTKDAVIEVIPNNNRSYQYKTSLIEVGSATASASNVALASMGAVATGTPVYDGTAHASAVNDGIRHTSYAWPSTGWSSICPGYVTIDFSTTRTISEIDVYTLADSQFYGTDPGPNDTFQFYGARDFFVQYSLDGVNFFTIASASNNNLVKRTFTFGAISCRYIRIYITSSRVDNVARLVEVEAYGF